MSQLAHIELVRIPQDLRSLLLGRLAGRSPAAWATEAVIIEAVREHIFSRNKGATLLGFEDVESRATFFNRQALSNEYTLEMHDEDFRTIDQNRGMSIR